MPTNKNEGTADRVYRYRNEPNMLPELDVYDKPTVRDIFEAFSLVVVCLLVIAVVVILG